ncbi:MAG: DUF885 domain-containing protein [Gammaproteobacteria bacterium]
MHRLVPAVLAVATLLFAGCSEAERAGPSSRDPAEATAAPAAGTVERPPEARWDALAERYVEEWLQAHPVFAVSVGRHEFDGMLPDWSAEGIRAEIERLKAFRAEVEAFDGATLDGARQFERRYLLSAIDRALFWLDDAQWPFRNPNFYFDWFMDRIDPDIYASVPYAPVHERMAAYIKFAGNLPGALAQIRANLRTPMPRTWVEQGLATFGGLASFMGDDIREAFGEVESRALWEQFDEANGEAVAALEELAAWFESLRETATEDFAMGPELYSRMLLKTQGLAIGLDDLERIGREDLERNLEALEAACAEFAPEADGAAACLAKMNARKPEGGAVAAARAQLGVIKGFLVENRLVSIPGDEPVYVKAAPPHARTNFAYINVAGPFDLGMPSTYYIAPPDPSWPEEEQRDYIPGQADLMSTSVHEVWPGHFVQFLHSNRAQSLIGRLFTNSAFVEGWAHYAEEMMWEAGLDGGLPGGRAEFRIGQINKALYRNVRFLCAIGLHTQGMSVEECDQMFREAAFQDPGNARQQAYRGTYDPGYLNYTLGKIMIRRLRSDWTAERGGREAWGAFHDAFLSYGGPPVPLLRETMLGPDAGPAL